MEEETIKQILLVILGIVSTLVTSYLIPIGLKKLRHKQAMEKDAIAKELEDIKNQRVITDKQMNILKEHPLNIHVNQVLNNIPIVYESSKKKGKSQKVFTLIVYYVLTIYFLDLKKHIDRVKENRIAEKAHVTRLVLEALGRANKNAEEHLLQCKIPPVVISKFLVWYREHYDWYIEHVEKVLNTEDTYFDQVKQTLYTSSTFLSALEVEFKKKIDVFNGDVEPELTDEVMLNINWGKCFLQGGF